MYKFDTSCIISIEIMELFMKELLLIRKKMEKLIRVLIKHSFLAKISVDTKA